MKILNAQFFCSIVEVSQRKLGNIPEIGFIGRSNVGKSSLINCLLLRKIARTSSTPGATRTINLYLVDYEFRAKRRSLVFSDFPGFGYTACPAYVYEKWERMVDSYVSQNSFIKRIVWVFDIRRDFDELDYVTFEWLNSKGLNFSLVVTKVDKVSKNEIKGRRDYFLKVTGNRPIFFVSAKNRVGRKELLTHIFETVSSS